MHNIVVNYWLHTPVPYVCIIHFLWRHVWRHRGVIWPYPSFSSITSDQIELERRWRHQYVQNELPNPMICNTSTLGQGTDLSSHYLTLTWGQHETWPFLNVKYIIRRVLARWTRWCQNFCSASIFEKLFARNKTPTFRSLTWPVTSPVDLIP